MIRHTLRILKHLLQDFQSVSNHFTILRSKGLKYTETANFVKRDFNTGLLRNFANMCERLLLDTAFGGKKFGKYESITILPSKYNGLLCL